MKRENLDALLQGIWAGDAEAAAQLMRRHGAEISRLVRLYLTDPHPCRAADAPAAGQLVLTRLCERAAAGRLDLRDPEALRLLLAALSRRLAVRATRPPRAALSALAPPEKDRVHHG